MSTTSELGHLTMPPKFISVPEGKTTWHKRVSNPGRLDPESYALPLRHTGWALACITDDIGWILITERETGDRGYL